MGSDVNGDGTEGGDRDFKGDEQRLFDQLAGLWQAHRRKGLEIRHRTGVLLNQHLGPPTEGQPYGREVLKRVGKERGIAQSDLSRMRWFAHHFDSLVAFQQAHPEINSWTGVKELLPSLNPREGSEAGGRPASPSRPGSGGVTRSLTGLIEKLRGMESIPEGKRGVVVREKLEELIVVATGCLGVRTPSPALETDSSPGDPARANAGD